MELRSDLRHRESPANPDSLAVGPLLPCLRFAAELVERGDAPPPQTLTGEQRSLHLRLIEPTAMDECIVWSESTPEPTPCTHPIPHLQRMADMGTEVVQHQMDGVRLRVSLGDVLEGFGKLHHQNPFATLSMVSSPNSRWSAG